MAEVLPAPGRRTRGAGRDEMTNRILSAADEVLTAAGRHPWSMATVAERAGISRRTLYRYFSSKPDLIEALPATGRRQSRTPSDPRPEVRPNVPASNGRRRLLSAARELFGRKGYEGASVREIAELAGVPKLAVYRHFGSKAALFQEATMDPIKEFIAEFVDRWSAEPPGQRHVIHAVHDFYADLYVVLQDQRDLLVPLLFAGAAHQGTEGLNNNQYLERVFKRWFDFMDRVMLAETSGHAFRPFDQPLASRLIFGMILSVVLHDEWLLDSRPDRDHLINEMANLTVLGILEPGQVATRPSL